MRDNVIMLIFHVGIGRFRGFRFDLLHLLHFVCILLSKTAFFASGITGIFLDEILYADSKC